MNKLASALLFAAPLFADMVVYEPSRDASSFNHWQAATPGAVYQGFDATVSGFTTVSQYAAIGISICGDCAFLGQQVLTDEVTDTNSTRFVFHDPVTAFGLYYDAAGPGGPGSGIQVMADGAAIGPTGMLYSWESGVFFGFISDTMITEVELTSPRDVNGNPYAGAAETYQTPGIWYAHQQSTRAVPDYGSSWELIVLPVALCMFAERRRRYAVEPPSQ